MSENLRPEALPFRIWGKDYIDPEAINQMTRAMSLPISVAGALMPDAHFGYGLPIGGVLATEGAVIPYAVGVDIACRMRLSVFSVSPNVLGQQVGKFKNALTEQTLFGAGKQWQGNKRAEHEVLDDPAWQQTRFLSTLKATAYGQLGTSGSGNHFVEWGALTLDKEDGELGLKAGEYLALLSHSGSRGVGFQIADRFTKLATDLNPNLDSS
ncbi:MAG: RtcB family protein, partial [Chitinophagaceae bacterium]|nr:RtcB family protein [Anaerolineae bacterium]